MLAWTVIGYTLWRGDDTRLAETAILGAFGVVAAIIAAYVGGSVYQDVSFDRHRRERDDYRIPTVQERRHYSSREYPYDV